MFDREQKTKELLSEIAKVEKTYEDKIASKIVSAIRKSQNADEKQLAEIWDTVREKIIDLIYQMLEAIYSLIIKFVKDCYPEADASKKMDLKSLTWQKDGKPLSSE